MTKAQRNFLLSWKIETGTLKALQAIKILQDFGIEGKIKIKHNGKKPTNQPIPNGRGQM